MQRALVSLFLAALALLVPATAGQYIAGQREHFQLFNACQPDEVVARYPGPFRAFRGYSSIG